MLRFNEFNVLYLVLLLINCLLLIDNDFCALLDLVKLVHHLDFQHLVFLDQFGLAFLATYLFVLEEGSYLAF